jgi:hypothetical protein
LLPHFSDISSGWVKIRLYTENWLPRLFVSALKVYAVGGWWWLCVLKANVVIDFGLSQAKQYCTLETHVLTILLVLGGGD